MELKAFYNIFSLLIFFFGIHINENVFIWSLFKGGRGQGGVLFNFVCTWYDATAHKMCLQIFLQNKPAKFYQETDIEIYKCIVLRIYKKNTLVVYSEYLLCSYHCKDLWHAW